MPFSGRMKLNNERKLVTRKLCNNNEISLPAGLKIVPPMSIFHRIFQGRVSSSTSKGSLTLEAACILPLFIYAIVCVMQFTQIIHLQTKIGIAVQQESKELARYAYAYSRIQDGDMGLIGQVAANGLSSVYVKKQVIDQVGEYFLEHSLVKGGSDGLSFYQSRFMEEGEIIDVVVIYKIKLRCNIFMLPEYTIVQRGRTHAWTGYENTGSGDVEQDEETLVYVAANGDVYHTSDKCTHINLSVSNVDLSEVQSLRNQGGGKYYPCEKCIGNKSVLGNVYITNTGDRYHAYSICSGIKRGITTMPISEVGSRRPCSRCGN